MSSAETAVQGGSQGVVLGPMVHRRWTVFVAMFGLAMCGCVAARGAEDRSAAGPPEESWVVLDERSADGEQCLVCRQQIFEGEIVEVRYQGRRFHVAAAMLDEFRANPDGYFSTLEARSALFDEEALIAPQVQTAWMAFGIYALVGLISGAVSAYLALGWGRPAGFWFSAGLVGNLIGLAALALAGPGPRARSEPILSGLTKVPVTVSPIECPACGSFNHPAAVACSACGRGLEPTVEPETARA